MNLSNTLAFTPVLPQGSALWQQCGQLQQLLNHKRDACGSRFVKFTGDPKNKLKSQEKVIQSDPLFEGHFIKMLIFNELTF